MSFGLMVLFSTRTSTCPWRGCGMGTLSSLIFSRNSSTVNSRIPQVTGACRRAASIVLGCPLLCAMASSAGIARLTRITWELHCFQDLESQEITDPGMEVFIYMIKEWPYCWLSTNRVTEAQSGYLCLCLVWFGSSQCSPTLCHICVTMAQPWVAQR